MEIVPAGMNDAHDILSLQRRAYTSEAEIYGDYSIPPLLQSITEIKVDLEKYTYLIAGSPVSVVVKSKSPLVALITPPLLISTALSQLPSI